MFDFKGFIIKDKNISAFTQNDLSIFDVLKAASSTLLAGIGIISIRDSIERHVFEDNLFQNRANIIFNKNGIFLSDLQIKPFWVRIKVFVVIYDGFVSDSGAWLVEHEDARWGYFDLLVRIQGELVDFGLVVLALEGCDRGWTSEDS